MPEVLVKVDFPIVHLNLASLCLSTEDFEGALEESYEFFRLAGEAKNRCAQRRALVFKGRAFLGLKDMDGARKTADELLLTLKDVKDKRAMKTHHLLDGLIDLESGNPKKAAEILSSYKNFSLIHYTFSVRLTDTRAKCYLSSG